MNYSNTPGQFAGHYIDGSSFIHRLDARAKVLCFLLLVVSDVLVSSPWEWGAFVASMVIIAMFTELSPRALLGNVLSLWQFFIIIILLNALFTDSTTLVAKEASSPETSLQDADILWHWWIFNFSVTGLLQGLIICARVAVVMVIANIMTCTTTVLDETNALSFLLKPLKLFHIPVDMISMILSIAIQFIPVITEEAGTIRRAQLARGSHLENRTIRERLSGARALVVPVFLASFRHADELSLAMEARGYRFGAPRTKRKQPSFAVKDFVAILVCALLCISFIVMRIWL
jgi:energy-coupling factor transport system permease protein